MSSYENCRVSSFNPNIFLTLRSSLAPCLPSSVPSKFRIPQLLCLPFSQEQRRWGGYSSRFGILRPPLTLFKPFLFRLFHALLRFFALFCAPQKVNSFLFKRFPTLCQKTKNSGVAVPSAHFAQIKEDCANAQDRILVTLEGTHAPPLDSHCLDSVALPAAPGRCGWMAPWSRVPPSHSPRTHS